MGSFLNQAAQDLAPLMGTEDISAINQEIANNMDYYLQEHQAELQRMVHQGQIAHQALERARQVPVVHLEEDDVYDWDTLDVSNQ